MRYSSKAILGLSAAALIACPARAVVVFSDDFELPDVTAAQSAGYTSGTVSTDWVGATQGFGANRRGTVDEAQGDFVDPVGQQAFAFRYTNSGVTSAQGVIGALTLGNTYNVSFDVVMDGNGSGTPWRVKLVTFDDFALRNDVRNDAGSSVLVNMNGNATSDGLYTNISFSFSADEVTHAASIGKDLAIRFIGGTTSASIDNVVIDVTPPGPEFFLKLQVDTTTGATTLLGRPANDIEIDYYQITSAGNSLSSAGWQSLEDLDYEGNGPINNTGNGWQEAGGSGPHALGEGYLLSSSTIPAAAQIDLGSAYNTSVDAQDLVFTYRTASGQFFEGIVEYLATATPGDTNGDGDIDDSDLGTSFANYTGPIGAAGGKTFAQGDTDNDGDVDDSDLGTSFSNYTGPLGPTSVPEPAGAALIAIGGGFLFSRRRGRLHA